MGHPEPAIVLGAETGCVVLDTAVSNDGEAGGANECSVFDDGKRRDLVKGG